MITAQTHDERRSTPRLSCHLDIKNEGIIIGKVENVSLGGVLITTSSQLLQNHRYKFQLIIPSSKSSVTFYGKIAHGNDNAYGVEIVSIDYRSKRTYEKYVVSLRESCQLRDILNALKNNQDTLILEDKETIRNLFYKTQESHCPVKISLLDHYQPLQAVVDSIGSNEIILRSRTHMKNGIQCPAIFYCVAMINYNSFYFELNCREKRKDLLICSIPSQIYFSERRREERSLWQDSNVRISITGPLGSSINGRLIDFSSNGACARFPLNTGLFFTRTPLKEVRLENIKGEKKAIVRSVRSAGDDAQDIGLQFVDDIRTEDFTVNPVTNFQRSGFLERYVNKAKNIGSVLYHKIRKQQPTPSSTVFRPVTFNNTHSQRIAALLDTSFDITQKIKTPMVVVIPAWGSKKESLSALAAVITHNFREKGQPIAVLRFDLTNHLGESYKDPEAQAPGKESLHITPDGILSDIRGAIAFAKNNPYVHVGDIIFVSFSFSAPIARRIILEDKGNTVKYWVNAMGCSDLAEIMKTVSGGIDYIENYKKGTRIGVCTFYGVTANIDKFCQSAIELGFDSYIQAKREFSQLPIPVTSIYGKYDGWIDANHVRELAGLNSQYPRDLIEMPSGHLPKSTDEALENFEVVTNKIFHFIHGKEILSTRPSAGTFLKKIEEEKRRVKKEEVSDISQYWENYMVGGQEDKVGYDILKYSPDYNDFLNLQYTLLDLRQGQVFCDFSCGTGLFETLVLSQKSKTKLPSTIILTDFVEKVLRRAELNIDSADLGLDIFYETINLNLSDEIIFKKFREGRYSSVASLKNEQILLSNQTIEKLINQYDGLIHSYLRGDLELVQAAHYKQIYGEEAWSEIEAVHLYFKGSHLTGKIRNKGNCSISLETESIDRVLISIVLPYLLHPSEVVDEIYRVLKPGGIVVASTMRKDSDFSIIFKRVLQEIESRPVTREIKEQLLNQARSFMNEAAQLWRLTEESVFQFFTQDEFRLLFELSGFHDIMIEKSYGEPEQAIIVRAKKPLFQS